MVLLSKPLQTVWFLVIYHFILKKLYTNWYFQAHHIGNPENIFRRTCYWLPGIPRPPSKPHPCHQHNHKFEYHTKSKSSPPSRHVTKAHSRQPTNAITVDLSRPTLIPATSKKEVTATFAEALGVHEANEPPSPAYAPPSPAYQASYALPTSQADLAAARMASAAVPSAQQSANALSLPGLSLPGTINTLAHHSLHAQPREHTQTSLKSGFRNDSANV